MLYRGFLASWHAGIRMLVIAILKHYHLKSMKTRLVHSLQITQCSKKWTQNSLIILHSISALIPFFTASSLLGEWNKFSGAYRELYHLHRSSGPGMCRTQFISDRVRFHIYNLITASLLPSITAASYVCSFHHCRQLITGYNMRSRSGESQWNKGHVENKAVPAYNR